MKIVISSIVVLSLLIMSVPALADIETPGMKTNRVMSDQPFNLEFKAGALVGRTSPDTLQLAAKKDKQAPVVVPDPPVSTSSTSNRKDDKTPMPDPPGIPSGFDKGKKKGCEGDVPPGHVASPSS